MIYYIARQSIFLFISQLIIRQTKESMDNNSVQQRLKSHFYDHFEASDSTFLSAIAPQPLDNPSWVSTNKDLAEMLGISADEMARALVAAKNIAIELLFGITIFFSYWPNCRPLKNVFLFHV